MKKINTIVGIFLIVLILLTSKVKATYTSNDPTVTSDETITITVTSSENIQNFDLKLTSYTGLSYLGCSNSSEAAEVNSSIGAISYATSKAGTKTLGTYTFKAPTVTEKTTYKVAFDINGIVNTSIVTVNPKTTNESNNTNSNTSNGSGQTTTTPTKSNVATLKNLGIKPNDFKGFSPNKYSYDVEVPNETETIEVYAYKGQDKQTITGTGSKKLKVGQNKFEVQVTAEDGTTKKTYTINVTRKDKTEENPDETEEIPSDDENIENTLGLSELSIEGFELNPQFQTDVYDYNVEISDSIEKLNITTVATEANANIEITGNENFKEGENVVTILVKSQDEKNTIADQIIANKKVPELIAETEEKVNENENIIIISVIVAAIILIILIIIMIIKSRKSSKNIESTYIPYGSLINKNDNEEIDEEDDNNDEIENYENMTPENYEEPKIKTKGTFIKELYEKADENENIENGYSGRTEKKKHSKGKRFK